MLWIFYDAVIFLCGNAISNSISNVMEADDLGHLAYNQEYGGNENKTTVKDTRRSKILNMHNFRKMCSQTAQLFVSILSLVCIIIIW